MGDTNIRVVPADMDADAARWGSAAESLGKAHRAVPALGVSFGGFQSVVGATYSAADLAVQNMIEVGASRLRATSANVTSNNTRTKTNDMDADSRVRQAANRGGGGGGADGSSRANGSNGSGDGGEHGSRGTSHYADLMGGRPMPTDPQDPEITFDRTVDLGTGEVTWTPREMKPGEALATDGRDVERIPQRADRIVVTMVDGEPQITYVDEDARPEVKETGWEAATGVAPESRVVPGSGAQEPQPQTEWCRRLPAGADYAVVEVRDGEPHLVFLDVQGKEVTQVADHTLADREPADHAVGREANEVRA